MAFLSDATIERPRAEVWAAATNWSNAPLWMEGIEDLRPTSDEPITTGSTLTFRSRGASRQTAVTRWQPETVFALSSRQGGMTATYVYRFEDTSRGTRVTLNADCEGEGPFWRLATPLISFLMARADRGQPNSLKAMIEAAGPTR